jgi:hypothetical protein
MWTSAERLYVTADRSALMPDPDETAVLLCGEWDRIPFDTALALGLCDADGQPIPPATRKRRARAAEKEGD